MMEFTYIPPCNIWVKVQIYKPQDIYNVHTHPNFYPVVSMKFARLIVSSQWVTEVQMLPCRCRTCGITSIVVES
jgi:hypothetical protein